jgi:hypothetical protein
MKLYSHQQKIIDDDPTSTGLFLGTGSGKTRIALLLARGNTLVICPKTQKEDGNWEREARTLGMLQPFVISKETFRRDHESLPGFDTVIVDEAHTCLGVTPNTRQRKRVVIPKTSQLYEALESFMMRTKPQRVYLCTATIMRSPMTVWGTAQVLGKGEVVGDFRSFRDTFYVKLPMPGRDVYAPRRDEDSKDKLANYVKALGYVGRLEDFFDVPEQTFKTDYIELTAEQKARIKELRIEYPEPIVRVGKQHQVENGGLAGDEFSEGETFKNGKIDKILDYAAEFPRMVIFAKYRAQISATEKALKKEGYQVWTLTGDTKDRGKVLAEANEASVGVLIAQAQVSAGWELPQYPVMIFASCTYSFVDRVQGEGRILRANALKKNLYIDLVVKGGVDEAVYKALKDKKDFDDRLYA